MNKELFVSSTPHETKVGLVEDDLLAEIYMERENEYTLAGSIYKGRVTRVLPGMQSAFVDIGLERDAFLYVSDFMELEEHDDDLTDVVPATRSVPDLRQPPARIEASPDMVQVTDEGLEDTIPESDQEFAESEGAESQPSVAASGAPEPGNAADQSQSRDRGAFRGRRRRRGGRRDGRGDGRDRGSERGPERSPDRGPERPTERSFERTSERAPEPRFSRPAEPTQSRSMDSGRSQPSGPPPGYQPIILPGESISKYQRYAQQPQAQEPVRQTVAIEKTESPAEPVAPLAATFPEDEPIFAATDSIAEPLHEEHDHIQAVSEEPAESASITTDWNQEFRRQEASQETSPEVIQEVQEVSQEANDVPSLGWPGEGIVAIEEEAQRESMEEFPRGSSEGASDEELEDEHDGHAASQQVAPQQQAPVFAAPGTMEEETIDEEEADAIRYESSSDEGYDEFEEETQAGPGHLNGEAREVVAEIHHASLTESGEAHPPEEIGRASC